MSSAEMRQIDLDKILGEIERDRQEARKLFAESNYLAKKAAWYEVILVAGGAAVVGGLVVKLLAG